MGKAWSSGSLTGEMVEEYAELTYLSRAEIVHIYNRFESANPDGRKRLPMPIIVEEFRELKYNPFRYRVFSVFSSQNDDCLSFEDVLDMASALSKNAPAEVKAAWAFKIFDVDGDNQLGPRDIEQVIYMLTHGNLPNELNFSKEEKDTIIKYVFDELDLDKTMCINPTEFSINISKVGAFLESFQLTF